MPILWKNNNLSDNFEPHIDKKSDLKKLDLEKNNTNLIGKNLDIKNCAKNILLNIVLKISYLKVNHYYFWK